MKNKEYLKISKKTSEFIKSYGTLPLLTKSGVEFFSPIINGREFLTTDDDNVIDSGGDLVRGLPVAESLSYYAYVVLDH